MKLRLIGSFVCLFVVSLSGTALASPRTGSISIPGGEPLRNGGTAGQDMTRVAGTYSPETGLFRVVIRFAAPVGSSKPAIITVHLRTDPSGSCSHYFDDSDLLSDTSPEASSPLGTHKTVSADKYEITLEDQQQPNRDYRCIFVTIGMGNAVYDKLSPPLYFEGFLTFKSRPVNTVLPKIKGKTSPKGKIVSNHGGWKGTSPITYRYQWMSCNKKATRCQAIRDATKSVLLIRSQYVGHRLKVIVTAVNAVGMTSATSKATAVIKT